MDDEITNLGKYFLMGMLELGRQGRNGKDEIVAALSGEEDEDNIGLIEEAMAQFDEILDEMSAEAE